MASWRLCSPRLPRGPGHSDGPKVTGLPAPRPYLHVGTGYPHRCSRSFWSPGSWAHPYPGSPWGLRSTSPGKHPRASQGMGWGQAAPAQTVLNGDAPTCPTAAWATGEGPSGAIPALGGHRPVR